MGTALFQRSCNRSVPLYWSGPSGGKGGEMFKTKILLALIAAIMLGGTSYALDYSPGSDRLAIAQQIPDFDLVDTEGRQLRSADILGQRHILMAFWSMYCRACVEKFGALVKIREKYPRSSLEIISVNTDGEYNLEEKAIREYIKGLEKREGFVVNFPVVYDKPNALATGLGIIFLPAIITADPEGRITGIYRRFTESSDEEIITGIEGIIPEAAGKTAP